MPPPRPVVLGELRMLQFGGQSSAKELDSPMVSHVSVTKRKSSLFDVKKSWRMMVLLASDLALVRAMRVRRATFGISLSHLSERRFCGFTPLLRRPLCTEVFWPLKDEVWRAGGSWYLITEIIFHEFSMWRPDADFGLVEITVGIVDIWIRVWGYMIYIYICCSKSWGGSMLQGCEWER